MSNKQDDFLYNAGRSGKRAGGESERRDKRQPDYRTEQYSESHKVGRFEHEFDRLSDDFTFLGSDSGKPDSDKYMSAADLWWQKKSASTERQSQFVADYRDNRLDQPNAAYPRQTASPNSETDYDVQTVAERERRAAEQRELRRHRMRRQRRVRFRAGILLSLILLTLILTFVLIRLIVNRSANQTGLRFITSGTLYRTVDGKAIVIRNEKVEKAAADGFVQPLAGEGERVAYGQKLALISAEDIAPIRGQLNDVLQKISGREMELISLGQSEDAQKIYNKSEDSLRELVRSIAVAAAGGEVREAKAAGLRINSVLENRNRELKKISFNDPVLKDLTTTRDRLERELTKKSRVIKAGVAGLATFSVDGFEDKLPGDKIDTITGDNLQEIFKANSDFSDISGQTAKDHPVIRMVNGLYQYFAVLVKEKDLGNFNDDKVDIYLPDMKYELKDCRITHRLPANGGTYLFIRTEKKVEGLLRERRVNIQLRVSAEQGLIVPFSALKFSGNESDLAEMAVVQSGFAHFAKVKVGIRSGDKAVVTPLNKDAGITAGSLVVQNPAGIKEGDKLE